MIGVLLRLQGMTLRGRVRRSLRLLRQPKYLVGSVIGAIWIMLWVGRPLLQARPQIHTVNVEMLTDELRPAFHLLAALLLSVALVLPWLLPWGRLGLPFREVELTLLLQAPLTRRQVIAYGLLKSSIGTLITALILSLVMGSGGPGLRVLLFVGLLLLFLFWGLNTQWRALFLLRQRELPVATARLRRWLVVLGCGAYLLSLFVLTLRFLQQLFADLRGLEGEALFSALAARPWPPLLVAMLAPARLLTSPLFADGAASIALAMAPVLAMVVVQLELVLRSPARFEESALERARRTETKKSRSRRGRRQFGFSRRWQVFGLRPRGAPAVAVLWKNLMRVSRLPLIQGAAIASLLLVALAVVPAVLLVHTPVHAIMIVIGLITAGISPLFSGMSWRNDLRTEFGHLELVRTWPVGASRLVLAEVASPALLSFFVSALGVGTALAGFAGNRLGSALSGEPSEILFAGADAGSSAVGYGLALLAATGILPLTAGAAFACSAMQNLLVLFVPAWLAEGPDSNRGIAAFGHRLVFGMAMFLAFLLSLIPSAMLVGLAWLVQHLLGIPWTPWVLPLWGLLAAAPLFVGGGLIVFAAGRLWEALDPSQEVLEVGR